MIYLVATLTCLLIMAIAYISHVTIKLKELEKSTIELNHRLEEKQHLLSVLFHDLSNSTTLLSLLSDSSILETKDKSGILQNLNRVSGVIDSMSGLIQHIRQIQSIENGKTNIELVPVNLYDSINSSIELINKRIETKKQHVRIDMKDRATRALAEPSSLCHSVFNNLLTNASKFSPEGAEIVIKVTSTEKFVRVDIIDQGIGIPSSMSNELFSFTNMTHREGTKGEDGSGFGLPVVKKYLNFYGGDIRAFNNSDGVGSTFSMNFINPGKKKKALRTKSKRRVEVSH